MTTKQCNKCKVTKPLSAFTITRKTNSQNFHAAIANNHYHGTCKSCKRIIAKQYYEKNKNKLKQQRSSKTKGLVTKYPDEVRLLISAIRDRVSQAKQNTKRNPEREFNINADYMYEIWNEQEGLCALSGLTLAIQKDNPYALSIDKLNPELGYIKGNVQWTCWMANRAKGDLSIDELKLLCSAILEKV